MSPIFIRNLTSLKKVSLITYPLLTVTGCVYFHFQSNKQNFIPEYQNRFCISCVPRELHFINSHTATVSYQLIPNFIEVGQLACRGNSCPKFFILHGENVEYIFQSGVGNFTFRSTIDGWWIFILET